MDISTSNNSWVESYLEALMSFGLSHEHVNVMHGMQAPSQETIDADRLVAQKYYVRQVMQQSEESIRDAWSKAAVGTATAGHDRDARLQYVSWRAWTMKRKRAAVLRSRERAARGALLADELEEHLATAAAAAAEERRVLVGRQQQAINSLAEAEEEGEQPEEEQQEEVEHVIEDGITQVTHLPGVPIPGLHLKGLEVPGMQLPGSSLTSSTIFNTHFSSPKTSLGGMAMMQPGSGSEAGGVDPLLVDPFPKLYIVLISLHGLIRGDKMELGRDPDTGGQVKYVVELARALGCIPSVVRVDLLTRLVADPSVDASYSVPEERLGTPDVDVRGSYSSDNNSSASGAFIVRLPCGPPSVYLRKEDLWAHTREFADRAIEHATSTLARLQQESGTPVQLFAIHGHYADAGEVAATISHTLGVDMVLTGHSLGRNKLEHLLKSGCMTAAEIEATYRISRRIEGEERALDGALVVFTSTKQEITDQWGLYDGYGEQLAAALQLRPCPGYHVPRMEVVPPGLDFSNLKVSLPEDPWEAVLGSSHANNQSGRSSVVTSGLFSGSSAQMPVDAVVAISAELGPTSRKASRFPVAPSSISLPGTSPELDDSPEALTAALAAPGAQQPPVWKEIFRFLRNPHKPVILAMCRPDAKKNVATLVRAYGSSKVLRELANLVLILGNRDIISALAPGSQSVMNSILRLIDEYDMYGSVAYPKHHTQADISDIYLLATATKGVFVNIALQEPFGLTLIEAAAHGAPIVATTNGGPVDIINTLHNGTLVDPNNEAAITEAIQNIIIDTTKWEAFSSSGRRNIVAYSWPNHCAKCLRTVKDESERNGGTSGSSGSLRTVNHLPSGQQHSYTLSLEDLSSLSSESPAASLRRGSMTDFLMIEPESLTAQGSVPRPQHSGVSDLQQQQPMPKLSGRKRFVVLSVDVPEDLVMVTRVLTVLGRGKADTAESQSLKAALLGDGQELSASEIGMGVMCPWSFTETKQLLEAKAGIDASELDFLVCDAGAMMWHVMKGAEGREESLKCDEDYERHVDFRWHAEKVKQVLRRVISSPVGWGKLQVMVAAAPAKGSSTGSTGSGGISLKLHPGSSPWHHSINISLAAPGVQAVHPSFKPDMLLAIMRRKLRRCGIRTQLLLTPGRTPVSTRPASLTPRGGALAQAVQAAGTPSPALGPAATLHVTPLRASRPLALRFLAHRNKIPLEAFTVLAFSSASAVQAAAAKSAAGAAPQLQQHKRLASIAGVDNLGGKLEMVRPVYFASNDGDDLLGGLPRAVVLPGMGAGVEREAVAFGVDASVYEEHKVVVMTAAEGSV